MGMSSGIVGFRDLDGDSEFQKMLAVKKACEAAEVDYPQEVKDYFEYPEESEELLRREKAHIDIQYAVEDAPDCHSAEEAWIVDITKLPKECTKVRFGNSW